MGWRRRGNDMQRPMLFDYCLGSIHLRYDFGFENNTRMNFTRFHQRARCLDILWHVVSFASSTLSLRRWFRGIQEMPSHVDYQLIELPKYLL